MTTRRQVEYWRFGFGGYPQFTAMADMLERAAMLIGGAPTRLLPPGVEGWIDGVDRWIAEWNGEATP
jgi:hypothetical protein